MHSPNIFYQWSCFYDVQVYCDFMYDGLDWRQSVFHKSNLHKRSTANMCGYAVNIKWLKHCFKGITKCSHQKVSVKKTAYLIYMVNHYDFHLFQVQI